MKRRVNLTKGVSTSTGAERLVLTGAPGRPYRAFGSVLAHGDLIDLVVTNRDADQWQVATYAYDGGANALTFQTLLESPTGASIDFAAGIKDIKCAPLAQDDDEIKESIEGLGEDVAGIESDLVPLTPLPAAVAAIEDALVPLEPLPDTVAEIEAQVGALEVEIGDLPAGNWSSVPYADVAAGEADTTDTDLFLVASQFADGFADLYENNGGTGEYTGKTLPDYAMVDGLRQGLAATQIIGRPIDQALVTRAGGTTLQMVFAEPAKRAGVIRRVEYYGVATKTAYVLVRSVAGAANAFVSEQSFPVTAGFHAVTLNLPIAAGQVVGIFSDQGIAYDGTLSSDSGGVWAVNSHNTTSFNDETLNPLTRLEVRVYIEWQSVTSDAIAPLANTLMCEPTMLAGRLLQPLELSASLQIVRGRWLDDGSPYDPLSPTAKWVVLEPILFNGRLLQPFELSASLQVVRGRYLDDGSPYDPFSPIANWLLCEPIDFNGRLLQPTRLSATLQVVVGYYLDTLEPFDPLSDAPGQSGESVSDLLYFVKSADAGLINWKGSKPESTEFVQWVFNHAPNPAKRQDVWRSNGIYRVLRLSDYSYGSPVQIADTGEYENAIKEWYPDEEDEAPNHMGGAFHGNEELFGAPYWLIDGVPQASDVVGNFTAKRIEFFQNSHLYHVGTSTDYTPPGSNCLDDYKRWVWTPGELELTHNIVVLENMSLFSCLVMLPVVRAGITNAGARSPMWLQEALTDGHAVTWAPAQILKAWGDTGYSVEMEVLEGADISPDFQSTFAEVSDRNKFYFDFAGGNLALTAGQVLRIRVRYRIQNAN